MDLRFEEVTQFIKIKNFYMLELQFKATHSDSKPELIISLLDSLPSREAENRGVEDKTEKGVLIKSFVGRV